MNCVKRRAQVVLSSNLCHSMVGRLIPLPPTIAPDEPKKKPKQNYKSVKLVSFWACGHPLLPLSFLHFSITCSLMLWHWENVIVYLLISQEASLAIPLFSPVLVPMAQSIGPFLSQIASSPTIRFGVRV